LSDLPQDTKNPGSEEYAYANDDRCETNKKKLPNNTIANLTLYETKRCFNLSVPRQTIIALKQLARLLAELAPELRAQLLNGPI